MRERQRNSAQEILHKSFAPPSQLYSTAKSSFDLCKVKGHVTANVFLRKPRCFNFCEDVCFYIHRKYLIIMRLLSNVVGMHCQWTVTAKMPNLYIHKDKKLDKSKSSPAISRCIPKAAAGRWAGIRIRQQSMLTGQLVYPLILIPHSTAIWIYVYIHTFFTAITSL